MQNGTTSLLFVRFTFGSSLVRFHINWRKSLIWTEITGIVDGSHSISVEMCNIFVLADLQRIYLLCTIQIDFFLFANFPVYWAAPSFSVTIFFSPFSLPRSYLCVCFFFFIFVHILQTYLIGVSFGASFSLSPSICFAILLFLFPASHSYSSPVHLNKWHALKNAKSNVFVVYLKCRQFCTAYLCVNISISLWNRFWANFFLFLSLPWCILSLSLYLKRFLGHFSCVCFTILNCRAKQTIGYAVVE